MKELAVKIAVAHFKKVYPDYPEDDIADWVIEAIIEALQTQTE